MSSEDGELYIMSEGDEEVWVSPTPAETAIQDAVAGETDLEVDDLDALEEYVDPETLRDLLEGDGGEVSFSVEDYDVTVTGDGTIEVE